MIELPQRMHPWFVGCQFHPEFTSNPRNGHPLFIAFVEAALAQRAGTRSANEALCGFEAGLDQPLFLIAGPCVIESEQLAMDTAGALKEICAALDVPFIYKSSFDKANRSSAKSFRGLGMDEGLRILAEVKKKIGVPVLTDVHEDTPLERSGGGGGCAADAGVPVPADQLHPERGAPGQAGEHQEGPVPGAVGHEECGGQGTCSAATTRSWCASAA